MTKAPETFTARPVEDAIDTPDGICPRCKFAIEDGTCKCAGFAPTVTFDPHEAGRWQPWKAATVHDRTIVGLYRRGLYGRRWKPGQADPFAPHPWERRNGSGK